MISAALRLDAYFALVRQALLMDEAHEAARAVAALLDLAAIGIEDAVAEIDAGRRRTFDHQDLVATDAKVAVGEKARLGRRRHEVLVDGVEHDKVVAEAVHFGEADSHGRSIRRVASADFWQLRGQWRLFRGAAGQYEVGRLSRGVRDSENPRRGPRLTFTGCTLLM